MSSTWKFRLLGQFSLDNDGGPVEFFGNRKDDELLALLALGHNLPQLRDDIALAIWPDVELLQARKYLSYNLFMLKRRLDALGAPNLILDSGSRALRIAPGVVTDLWEFNVSVAIASADPTRLDEFERAMSLYNGGLLPKHTFLWLREHQDRVRQRFALTVELFEEVAHPSAIRLDLLQQLPPSGRSTAPATRHIPSPQDTLDRLRGLAIGAETGLLSATRTSWLDQIDAAWPQIEELLARANRTGDAGDALDIASRMWRYWLMRSDIATGWRLIAQLFLNLSSGPHARRARAHHALGMLASYQGDHDVAREHLDAELAIWREAQGASIRQRDTEPVIRQKDEVTAGILRALSGSAVAHYNAGDYESAGTSNDQAITIARVLDDRDALIRLLYNRALGALKLRDAATAQELLHERLSYLEDGPDDERFGSTHAHLTSAYMLDVDERLAWHHGEIALKSLSDRGPLSDRILCHQVLGRIAHNNNQLQASVEHLQAAVALARESESLWWTGSSMRYLALALRDAGELELAHRHADDTRKLLRAAGADDELRRFETAWGEGAADDPLA